MFVVLPDVWDSRGRWLVDTRSPPLPDNKRPMLSNMSLRVCRFLWYTHTKGLSLVLKNTKLTYFLIYIINDYLIDWYCINECSHITIFNKHSWSSNARKVSIVVMEKSFVQKRDVINVLVTEYYYYHKSNDSASQNSILLFIEIVRTGEKSREKWWGVFPCPLSQSFVAFHYILQNIVNLLIHIMCTSLQVVTNVHTKRPTNQLTNRHVSKLKELVLMKNVVLVMSLMKCVVISDH